MEETDERTSQEDLVQDVYLYLTERSYPAGASANLKRVIRNKAKKFSVRNGELFYTHMKRGRGCSKVHIYLQVERFISTLEYRCAHIVMFGFCSQPTVEVKYVQGRKEKQRILKACHSDPTSGHMGVKRTLTRITERFMWPGVVKDVEQLVSYREVSSCDNVCRFNDKLYMYNYYVGSHL